MSLKTFTCTHPGHEGDREIEGVPFGPRGEEWCQACFWFEQDPHSPDDGRVLRPVGHTCGHSHTYWFEPDTMAQDRARLGAWDCPSCRIAQQNREAAAMVGGNA